MAEASMHRALAAAQNGAKGNASSDNPHEAAVGKLQAVSMPKPPADNTVKPQLKKVDLGRDTSSTSINFAQPEERMGNLVQSK
jgi:hypothetical protein